eukprot:scaffold98420_cov35-Prasinocladus_malaysianus.AAC.1
MTAPAQPNAETSFVMPFWKEKFPAMLCGEVYSRPARSLLAGWWALLAPGRSWPTNQWLG